MPWEESRIYLVRGSRVYMARVGTPMEGAVEERAECGKWSGNWKDGAKRARSSG